MFCINGVYVFDLLCFNLISSISSWICSTIDAATVHRFHGDSTVVLTSGRSMLARQQVQGRFKVLTHPLTRV